MNNSKIAITIDKNLLLQVDRLVGEHRFPNRSRVFQEAVREKLAHIGGGRLARESAKLNPQFEQKLAEEGLEFEGDEWPEY